MECLHLFKAAKFGSLKMHVLCKVGKKFSKRNISSNVLIETLYRENVSFRDRDLNGKYHACHTASENLDAQLLRNDTSFLSNLLCKSPLINYSPTIFVRLLQPIH